MPVIKSAKKRMRQNLVRRARNYPIRSELKSLFKKELAYIKGGNKEEAEKFLGHVYSVIDTACKKKLIHPNTASRKKSRLARALNDLVAGKVAHVAAVKQSTKAKAKAKAEKASANENAVEEPVDTNVEA